LSVQKKVELMYRTDMSSGVSRRDRGGVMRDA
jgi:hypothetical protein